MAFLDETFGARTTNPQCRRHQQAAQAVLEALLPQPGSDIKGRIRAYPELLDISGYGKKPRAFKELMRILDAETRLLTPADPEAVGSREEAEKLGARFYQLTHDYLVPALRQWLVKKQESTRSGRAELRLAERSAMWNARPERRQLPSLVEWARISLLTRNASWTPSQRKMMRAAARQYAIRTGLAIAVVAFFLSAGLEVMGLARDLLMQFRGAAPWSGWPSASNKPSGRY